MPVLSDKWIKKMSEENSMISPFEEKQIRVIVYLMAFHLLDMTQESQMNLRSSKCKFRNKIQKILNHLILLLKMFEYHTSQLICFSRTEKFIPKDILVICLGKSTYARCGIIVNVTPLEPGWEGYVTLEFSNTTPLPAKIYANEGVAQFIFLKGNEKPEVTYADRNKILGQTGDYQKFNYAVRSLWS